jgi:hypothetical protein
MRNPDTMKIITGIFFTFIFLFYGLYAEAFDINGYDSARHDRFNQGFMYQIPRIISCSICLHTTGLEQDGKPTLLKEA